MRLVLFNLTFSCSFRQMLVSLHTSNETLEKKNDFKEAAAGSDDLLGRKAERNQRNREEALSGQLEPFIQNRDGNFWWKWSPGRQRRACYWFSHWDKAREDFLEVIITAAHMSAGPLGSTAAPGLGGSRGTILRGGNSAMLETSTNKSPITHEAEQLYRAGTIESSSQY